MRDAADRFPRESEEEMTWFRRSNFVADVPEAEIRGGLDSGKVEGSRLENEGCRGEVTGVQGLSRRDGLVRPLPSLHILRRFFDVGERIEESNGVPLTGLVTDVLDHSPLPAPTLTSSSIITFCSLSAVCRTFLIRLSRFEDTGVGGEILSSSGADRMRLGLGRSGTGLGKSGISVSPAPELECQAARMESSAGDDVGEVR